MERSREPGPESDPVCRDAGYRDLPGLELILEDPHCLQCDCAGAATTTRRDVVPQGLPG